MVTALYPRMSSPLVGSLTVGTLACTVNDHARMEMMSHTKLSPRAVGSVIALYRIEYRKTGVIKVADSGEPNNLFAESTKLAFDLGIKRD